MAKKGMLDAARRKPVVGAAKAGARGVKSVASDALGAAASAAAGVVVDRVSEALGSGQNKLEKMAPAASARARNSSDQKKRQEKRREKGRLCQEARRRQKAKCWAEEERW